MIIDPDAMSITTEDDGSMIILIEVEGEEDVEVILNPDMARGLVSLIEESLEE